jgi:hypothetical protein
MLVGEPPRTGADYRASALSRPGFGIQPPSQRRPGLWPGLDQLVVKALERDRDQRHSSMAVFGAALLRELESLDPVAATLLGAHPSWVVTDHEPGIGDLFGGVTLSIPESGVALAKGTAKSERPVVPPPPAVIPFHPGSSLDPYDAETVNGRRTPHSVAALLPHGIDALAPTSPALAPTQAQPVLPAPKMPLMPVRFVSAGPPSRGAAVPARQLDDDDGEPDIEIRRAPTEPRHDIGVGGRRSDDWKRRVPQLPADAQRLAPRPTTRRSVVPRLLFIVATVAFLSASAVTLAGDHAPPISATTNVRAPDSPAGADPGSRPTASSDDPSRR